MFRPFCLSHSYLPTKRHKPCGWSLEYADRIFCQEDKTLSPKREGIEPHVVVRLRFLGSGECSCHYSQANLNLSDPIYPTPLLEQDMTQGQFLKRSLAGLNSEFSFS